MVQLIEGASVICQNYRGTGKRLFGRISYIKEDSAFVKVLRFAGDIELTKLHAIPLLNLKAVDCRKAKTKLAEKKKAKAEKKLDTGKKITPPMVTQNSGINIVSSNKVTKPTNEWIGLGGSEVWFESGVYNVETNRWYKEGRVH